jgi:hypothetical protein
LLRKFQLRLLIPAGGSLHYSSIRPVFQFRHPSRQSAKIHPSLSSGHRFFAVGSK